MTEFDAAVLMSRPLEARTPRDWAVIATAEFMDISAMFGYTSRELRICAVCAVAELGDDPIEFLLSMTARQWAQFEADVVTLLAAKRSGAFSW